jgi:hypothetical protein
VRFNYCDLYQSLDFKLISPRIILAYRLSTSKLTLSDVNKDLPDLEGLLKHKRRLRKLWQVSRDPAYKRAQLGHKNNQINERH